MKKILVIVDMQKDFTTGVLGNAECAAAIPEVVKVVAEGNYDEIVLTKDTHDQTYLHTQEGKYLPATLKERESPTGGRRTWKQD